ncbi:ASB8 protein, partial [Brachypteracias leptosomus]|nr:ASB8 protein [Brachypteracias leptosomus]
RRTMWYILQNLQTKYALSECLICSILAIPSVPHENVEDLIIRVSGAAPGGDLGGHPFLREITGCYGGVPQLEGRAGSGALDGYRRTALHYAAEKDIQCVVTLLQHGADPNGLDGKSNPPLHWAAFHNQAECARALLVNGALVNALDNNNDTPLSWAAMKANLESMGVLLEFGADPRKYNLKGQSPISRLLALMVRKLRTHRENTCLELLLRATAGVGLQRDLPCQLRRDRQLCEKLNSRCSTPASLKDLSRCAVRRSLGPRFLPEAVEQLPLPTTLKDYVLLKN